MDRSAFLNSLPFLLPSEWIPEPSSTQKGPSATVHNDGGDGFSLSMEPILLIDNDSKHQVGPVLTSTTSTLRPKEEDPALCLLEVALVQAAAVGGANKMRTPSSSSSTSTALSISPSPRTPAGTYGRSFSSNATKSPDLLWASRSSSNNNAAAEPSQHNAHCMFVLVRLDKTQVFRLDLSYMNGMDLLEEAQTTTPATAGAGLGQCSQTPLRQDDDATTTQHRPRCLLLHFECCIFRIFSLKHQDSCKGDALRALERHLQEAWTAAASYNESILDSQELAQNSESTSGFSSSCHDSKEPSSPAHSRSSQTKEPAAHSSSPSKPSASSGHHHPNDTTTTRTTFDSITNRHKRRQAALSRTFEGVSAIVSLLNMPTSSLPSDHRNAAHVIGPILTATAEELASSYYRNVDCARVQRVYDGILQESHEQLDQVFQSAFPRSKKARRAAPDMESRESSNPSAAELLERARELARQQQEAVEEKYRTVLLPKRG